MHSYNHTEHYRK